MERGIFHGLLLFWYCPCGLDDAKLRDRCVMMIEVLSIRQFFQDDEIPERDKMSVSCL